MVFVPREKMARTTSASATPVILSFRQEKNLVKIQQVFFQFQDGRVKLATSACHTGTAPTRLPTPATCPTSASAPPEPRTPRACARTNS